MVEHKVDGLQAARGLPGNDAGVGIELAAGALDGAPVALDAVVDGQAIDGDEQRRQAGDRESGAAAGAGGRRWSAV